MIPVGVVRVFANDLHRDTGFVGRLLEEGFPAAGNVAAERANINVKTYRSWWGAKPHVGRDHEVSSRVSLGPLMTARRRAAAFLMRMASRRSLAVTKARFAGSGVSSSKRRSWQPEGASAEG